MRCPKLSAAAVVASMSLTAGAALAQETSALRDGCQAVWVTAPAFGKPAPRFRKPLNFSAAEVLDLEFQVLIRPDLLAGRSLELKILTPKGHLYQTLALPAPPDAAAP